MISKLFGIIYQVLLVTMPSSTHSTRRQPYNEKYIDSKTIWQEYEESLRKESHW